MAAAVAPRPANSIFRPATRKNLKLRMAVDGPAGAGKTFTGLRFAFALGKRVAVISTESGAVEKYQGLAPDGTPWEFDVAYLPDFSPTSYTSAILAAGQAGYDVLLIDSLSHAWAGEGGALEIKDNKGGNSFTAWKEVTPMHNRMVESILRSPCHVLATMRSKTAFVMEKDDKGRDVPKKVGLEPIQRAGMEYEFDVYCSLDIDHILKVSKSRCPAIDKAIAVKPGALFMGPVIEWLTDGVEVSPDYYAVTDADLNKHARAVEASKPPEQVARESAERRAAAAAKQAGVAATTNGNGHAANGAATNGHAPASDKATPATIAKIKALVPVLFGTPANFVEKVLKLPKYNVARTADLTEIQATAILAKMQENAAKAKLDAAAGPTAESIADNAKVATSVDRFAALNALTLPPATDFPDCAVGADQKDAIMGLALSTGWSIDAQNAWLDARKLSTFRNLSAKQADHLIDALKAVVVG